MAQHGTAQHGCSARPSKHTPHRHQDIPTFLSPQPRSTASQPQNASPCAELYLGIAAFGPRRARRRAASLHPQHL